VPLYRAVCRLKSQTRPVRPELARQIYRALVRDQIPIFPGALGFIIQAHYKLCIINQEQMGEHSGNQKVKSRIISCVKCSKVSMAYILSNLRVYNLSNKIEICQCFLCCWFCQDSFYCSKNWFFHHLARTCRSWC